MKDSTKDQIEGKAHEVKGKIKETLGKATNDPNLHAEGQASLMPDSTASAAAFCSSGSSVV